MKAAHRDWPILALLIALPMPASATDEPVPVWQGVWQGTVGSLPVRACLARRGDNDAVGSYYYLSRLRPIRLEQQNGSRQWLEGEGTSTGPARPGWTFATITAEQLGGDWSDGARHLPFRLTRVAGKIDDEPCGGLLFNAPRLRPLRMTAKRAVRDGVAYTRLTFDPGPAFPDVTLETFALAGDDPATRRINGSLRKPMTPAPADSEWFGCIAGALSWMGIDGDYTLEIAPTLITPRWLAAVSNEGDYCGGAHPNSDSTSLTFDRATGAAVDVTGWLDASLMRHDPEDRNGSATGTAALRAMVRARDKDAEPDCVEATAEQEYWDVGLARAGLTFTPSLPHVLAPCQNSVLVPWAALAPHLTAAGRAARASLSVAR